MHGYWSLVIFTLLGQAAAGMLILSFFSRTADTSRAKAWAACILLGVGALAHGRTIKLSDETGNFAGGCIIKEGNIETNCTFEVLVKGMRDELEQEVSNVLFGQ